MYDMHHHRNPIDGLVVGSLSGTKPLLHLPDFLFQSLRLELSGGVSLPEQLFYARARAPLGMLMRGVRAEWLRPGGNNKADQQKQAGCCPKQYFIVQLLHTRQ